MNREIKFRAWLEGTHGSITFNVPHMEYDIVIKDGKYADVEAGWDIHGTYDSIPIMQYTGLKDKNGVEIYEGDVVQGFTDFGYKNKGEVRYLSATASFAVFVGKDVMKEDEPDLYTWFQYNKDWEVIGNIFTHPQLVNQEK